MSASIDRRTLIKSGLLAGGALLGGGVALGEVLSGKGSVASRAGGLSAARRSTRLAQGRTDQQKAPERTAGGGAGDQAEGARSRRSAPGPYRRPPNILLIMVDQMRTPAWFSAAAMAAGLMPNLERLRRGGVSFDSHYTASNDCSPARSALVTGLYTHQTGCMITGGSTLDPGFPTWGTMLREQGYETWWYGKWHLTHGDNLWTPSQDAGALEPYGFSGGTYPSPDGGPGQGWAVDPFVTHQFEDWVRRAPSHKPWCTTVSFVNPHDIAWWYFWSDRFAAEAKAPSVVHEMPPNFETREQMTAQRKPRLQFSQQDTSAVSFGKVPFSGPQLLESWAPFMDLYLKLLHHVDKHVGQVMRALHRRPELAANTVVLFTSDHGEYGGSHGMRGKGAAVYEEAIRVPLIVKDLRGGKLTAASRRPRSGLTSSVDVAPLMLSIATESSSWRRDPHYSHLAGRHDLLSMLRKPSAPGRPYVLHATDEIVTEFAVQLYAANAPLHLTAIRTPHSKFALYSDWEPDSTKVLERGQEAELYDYSSAAGRMEIDNLAGTGTQLERHLRAKLVREARQEMQERLPSRLHEAHRGGFADYFETAAKAVVKSTERRRTLLERQREGHKLGAGLDTMLQRQRYGLDAQRRKAALRAKRVKAERGRRRQSGLRAHGRHARG